MQAIAPLTSSVSVTAWTFRISPALPASIRLNTVSGAISGTPTAIAPKANHSVTASGPSGSRTVNISIVVNDAPPTIAYPSPFLAFTNGVASRGFTPRLGGGAILTISINPALPSQLKFGQANGSISGTPGSGVAGATYLVSAANSGGQSTAILTVAISFGPILDLGHGALINLIRLSNSRVFSQDTQGHCVLWNCSTAGNIANGMAACRPTPCNSAPMQADFAESTVAIGTTRGFGTPDPRLTVVFLRRSPRPYCGGNLLVTAPMCSPAARRACLHGHPQDNRYCRAQVTIRRPSVTARSAKF